MSLNAVYPGSYNNAMSNDSLSHDELEKKLNEECLTADLVNQRIHHSPSDDDISRDKGTNTPHCINATFAKKCKNIFPIG